MKIAIIGSGIAGLTASHLLQKQGHEVHLYEAQNRLGMSAQSIDFPLPQGASSVCGDVPSRMFNGALWPSVLNLYQTIGLEIASVAAQQSYRRQGAEVALQFQMPFEWSREILKTTASTLLALTESLGVGKKTKDSSAKVASANGPIGSRRTYYLSQINRLRSQGLRDLDGLDRNMPFREYLDRNDFSADFRETFLYPALSSTVCTCSHEAISSYPAVILLEAMQHISGTERLCRVPDGARLVAERLSDNATVKLNTAVQSVEHSHQTVNVTAGGVESSYDHVVIATQANQAAGVCLNLAESEAAILDGFRYEDVDIVVHTDEQFMPSAKSDWSVFNFVAGDQDHESMCTVWMNQFHTDWHNAGMAQPIFQTIRPIHDVGPNELIRHARLQRPLVDRNSWELWRQLRDMHKQKDRRIWFCGSYAMPGIPLLESAVRSAIEISDAVSKRTTP